MILAIDIGNTRTKAGLFVKGIMKKNWNLSTAGLQEELSNLLLEMEGRHLQIGWMSVAGEDIFPTNMLREKFSEIQSIQQIKSDSDLPIKNRYATPATLGVDRIVAAIGAWSKSAPRAVLVIDAGTALTFDIINQHGEYLGGAISPGINMRFRALHEFTARLPLVTFEDVPPLIGDSTIQSMRSGVINGVIAEINGVINLHRATFQDQLDVYLTGGDMKLFENHLKNINFADAYLTLEGIYKVLNHKNLYE
ncbi:MAG: type III pantothenate kinase [Bacteroidetes bacterium]|nr:type III pantothenate kinase [Bacteroidota bacterium]